MNKQIDKSIYLDFNKPISYNAFMTYIITERGLGKSYGAKIFVAQHFLKKHKQFVYLRRYKTELKKAMNKNGFWKQVINDPRLKGHKFKNDKENIKYLLFQNMYKLYNWDKVLLFLLLDHKLNQVFVLNSKSLLHLNIMKYLRIFQLQQYSH